jgi:hypothetical protein
MTINSRVEGGKLKQNLAKINAETKPMLWATVLFKIDIALDGLCKIHK